ncbi:putative holin-like toxin [Anaerosacchariphilus polymeriproducens]
MTLEVLTLFLVLFAFGSFIVGFIALIVEIIKLHTKK